MIKYKIKQVPEDFIVEEIFNFNNKTGPYGIFKLTKKNYSTTSAVRIISRILRIPLKNIGFAGMKDKVAVTTQLISIKNSKKEIRISNLSTEFLGISDEPITLGSHEGNHFEIIVRNITKKPELKEKFINYFGEQRFSKSNIEIGRAIIKKDWKKAVELIDNEFILEHLKHNPTDYLGAIKTLPIKITRLFVASYQSYLWNETVNLIEEKPETLPIPGFGIELHPITQELMNKEGITERDFIIKQFPQLTLEGVEREVFSKVKNLEISELQIDELNKAKKKISLKFDLDKGCYATEFIRQLFE